MCWFTIKAGHSMVLSEPAPTHPANSLNTNASNLHPEAAGPIRSQQRFRNRQKYAEAGELGEVGSYTNRAFKLLHAGKHDLNHVLSRQAGGGDECAIAMTHVDHTRGASYGNTRYSQQLGKLDWETALLFEAHDLSSPYKGIPYEENYKPFIESLLQCHVKAGHILPRQLNNIMASVKAGTRPSLNKLMGL